MGIFCRVSSPPRSSGRLHPDADRGPGPRLWVAVISNIANTAAQRYARTFARARADMHTDSQLPSAPASSGLAVHACVGQGVDRACFGQGGGACNTDVGEAHLCQRGGGGASDLAVPNHPSAGGRGAVYVAAGFGGHGPHGTGGSACRRGERSQVGRRRYRHWWAMAFCGGP